MRTALLHFGHEFTYVLEFQIDGGKPEVGDLINAPEFGKKNFAYIDRFKLAFGAFLDGLFDFVDYFFKLSQADRPFFTGFEKSIQDFVAVESLSAAILLYNHVRYFIAPFVAGKPSAAVQALPPTPD